MGTILYIVKFGEGLMAISGREFLYEMFGNLINIQEDPLSRSYGCSL